MPWRESCTFWWFIVISNTRLTRCWHTNILEVFMWNLVMRHRCCAPPHELSDHQRKDLFRNSCDGDETTVDSCITECWHIWIANLWRFFRNKVMKDTILLTLVNTAIFIIYYLVQTKTSSPSSSRIAIFSIYSWLNTYFYSCCILY